MRLVDNGAGGARYLAFIGIKGLLVGRDPRTRTETAERVRDSGGQASDAVLLMCLRHPMMRQCGGG